MLQSIAAISIGASCGAVLRWMLGVKLNAVLPGMPLGTLTANVAGGYLVGLAIAWFAAHPSLAPEWRLLIITGFLGGLTTFSTFSAEVVTLLQAGRLNGALGVLAAHVLGSLAMTVLGIATFSLFRANGAGG